MKLALLSIQLLDSKPVIGLRESKFAMNDYQEAYGSMVGSHGFETSWSTKNQTTADPDTSNTSSFVSFSQGHLSQRNLLSPRKEELETSCLYLGRGYSRSKLIGGNAF